MHTIDFASVDAALPFYFDPDTYLSPSWHYGNWELDVLNLLKTGAVYKSRTVKMDVTAPEVMLANPVNPDWQQGPATLNFTGTDVGSGYDFTEWSTDGGATVNKGEVAQIGGNGVITVNYRGVDKVGIRSDWKATTVSVSTTRPTVTRWQRHRQEGQEGDHSTSTSPRSRRRPTTSSSRSARKSGRTLVSSHRFNERAHELRPDSRLQGQPEEGQVQHPHRRHRCWRATSSP